MTKEEYIQKMIKQEGWAPGWDAIDDAFDELYPGEKEDHYMTTLISRALFGGPEYLDGYSAYKNPKGYYHIVTYGMSELYPDPDSFGNEYSKWGYEMTMKLKENTSSDCIWAMNMMGNLARYTNQTGAYFKHGDFVIGDGTPIHIGIESMITGLVIVNDTSAKTIDTIHGKVEFLQLVGITTREVAAIREDTNNVDKLITLMKHDNPELITDTKRDFSYL